MLGQKPGPEKGKVKPMNFIGAAIAGLSAASLPLLFVATASAGVPAGQAAKNPVVIIETTMGDITVQLFKDKSPKTVENFLAYVKSGFYKGTVFHRVIKGFMIQGGGYTFDLKDKPTLPAIPNEAKNGLSNTRGTLAMARQDDPNSATSQFFINTVNNARLDYPAYNGGYAVFGKVIAGMDVVDKIENLPTGAKGGFSKDVPTQTVGIKDVKIKG
jgi:cyclophilin family peptidyl-prolyl cis-trans isomerase